MLMTCCAYSCTQHGLHTQYMLVTHADNLLCLQLRTVESRVLSAFAKLRKATVSFIFVRLELGSHWTDFRETTYLFFYKL